MINSVSLFNILFNLFARDLPLDALRVVGIGLPSAFTVIYGLAAYLIYREYGSSHGHRAEYGTPLLSHGEMQRRQLLRLLQEHTPPGRTRAPQIIRIGSMALSLV